MKEENYSDCVKKLQAILNGDEKTINGIENSRIFKEKLLEVEYSYIIKFMENHRKGFNRKNIKKLKRLAFEFRMLNGDSAHSEEKTLEKLNRLYLEYVLR